MKTGAFSGAEGSTKTLSTRPYYPKSVDDRGSPLHTTHFFATLFSNLLPQVAFVKLVFDV